MGRRYVYLGMDMMAAAVLSVFSSATVYVRRFFAEPIEWCFAELGRLCFGPMWPHFDRAPDRASASLFGHNGKLAVYERRRMDRLRVADPLAA